jgi:hypothetical protein
VPNFSRKRASRLQPAKSPKCSNISATTRPLLAVLAIGGAGTPPRRGSSDASTLQASRSTLPRKRGSENETRVSSRSRKRTRA